MKTLLIISLLLFAGCSSDSNNSSNNTNNSTDDMGTEDVKVEKDTDNSNAEYKVRYDLRALTMEFDEGTAAFKLNPIVEQNFDQTLEFPIIILFRFSMIDVDAGTLLLRGGAGLKSATPEEYEWEPSDGETDRGAGTLVPASGEFESNLEVFQFIATFAFEQEVRKVPIPIRELNIKGNLTLLEGGESAEISNGRISGYLTREDGDATRIAIQPGSEGVAITQVFGVANLNYDTTTGMEVDKGTGDAWLVTGSITAQETNIK